MRWQICLIGILIAMLSFRCLAIATPATTTTSDDRTAITDEIKTDQDAVKSITDAIAGYDKDASDAEAAAKNPPANLSDADKAAYIDQKKNDEQTAQDSAKDARERLAEAQKSLEDAKARLKALGTDEKKAI